MFESDFQEQTKIAWYKVSIDRDLLLELMKLRDLKGWQ